MNNNRKIYNFNNNISLLDRTTTCVKQEKSILVDIKKKQEKLYNNLDEIECFLNKTCSCLKIFKIYSFFK